MLINWLYSLVSSFFLVAEFPPFPKDCSGRRQVHGPNCAPSASCVLLKSLYSVILGNTHATKFLTSVYLYCLSLRTPSSTSMVHVFARCSPDRCYREDRSGVG